MINPSNGNFLRRMILWTSLALKLNNLKRKISPLRINLMIKPLKFKSFKCPPKSPMIFLANCKSNWMKPECNLKKKKVELLKNTKLKQNFGGKSWERKPERTSSLKKNLNLLRTWMRLHHLHLFSLLLPRRIPPTLPHKLKVLQPLWKSCWAF